MENEFNLSLDSLLGRAAPKIEREDYFETIEAHYLNYEQAMEVLNRVFKSVKIDPDKVYWTRQLNDRFNRILVLNFRIPIEDIPENWYRSMGPGPFEKADVTFANARIVNPERWGKGKNKPDLGNISTGIWGEGGWVIKTLATQDLKSGEWKLVSDL